MKIFHEAPLSIMNLVKDFTDGEYCLPHLLDESEEYKNYFFQAKEEGRYIIMDNSMHELGHPYDEERLMEWIYKLEPNEFIVPDILGEAYPTLKLAREWVRKIYPKNTLKVAVIQAQYEGDFYIQYPHYKSLGYDKICIPYGLKVYEKIFPHPNKWVSRTMGRILMVSKLLNNGFIKENDKIHLLGCNLPWEFRHYRDIPQVESMDSSNPIMAAIDQYPSYRQLDEKPSINLSSCFLNHKTQLPITEIIYNLLEFKEINGL